jgi:hypothetical protein
MTVPWELGMALWQQHPPVADWLEALSHDSPFEGGSKTSRGGRAVPSLSAVPSLFSLLKDSDRGIRMQAVTALGNLGELVRRIPSMLRVALRTMASTTASSRPGAGSAINC